MRETIEGVLARNAQRRGRALVRQMRRDEEQRELELLASSRGLLHDGAIGTLNRIADFGDIHADGLREEVSRLRREFRATPGDHAGPLDPHGSQPDDLRELVELVAGPSLLPVEIDAGPRVRLSPSEASAIARGLAEALRNVEQHAGRVRVEIAWQRRGGAVELRVRDHGPGLAGDAWVSRDRRAGSGVGLVESRQAPLAAIGGTSAVEDHRDGGVLVRMQWPRRDRRTGPLRTAYAETVSALDGDLGVFGRIAAPLLLATSGWLPAVPFKAPVPSCRSRWLALSRRASRRHTCDCGETSTVRSSPLS